MIKFLLKLAVAALIAIALWHIGSAYVAHFKFRDAVREAATYETRSDSELRARILELADKFDVPLGPTDPADTNALRIMREGRHILIEGSYVEPIEVLPGYRYPWRFSWAIEAEVTTGAIMRLNGLPQ
jgi:hypothetical protein